MFYTKDVKRKVFLSFHQKDKDEVDKFILDFATTYNVFTPKAIGTSDNDDFINSTDTDYVMSQIREKYLGDSTVTIVLIGSCTHSRRYVDWELKSSLRRGDYTPNGVLGIILPSQGKSAYLPPRFEENWNKESIDCYARFYIYPDSPDKLRSWIEDAYDARTNRAKFIKNSADMMKYNAKCRIHGITH